jgi:hypothetical protein
MSYVINLENRSSIALTSLLHPAVINGHSKWTSPVLGNEAIETSLAGRMTFQDVADHHVPGDTTPTWGVLIRYGDEAFVGRYEGGGQLNIVLDEFLQATLSGMSFRQVKLDYLRG